MARGSGRGKEVEGRKDDLEESFGGSERRG